MMRARSSFAAPSPPARISTLDPRPRDATRAGPNASPDQLHVRDPARTPSRTRAAPPWRHRPAVQAVCSSGSGGRWRSLGPSRRNQPRTRLPGLLRERQHRDPSMSCSSLARCARIPLAASSCSRAARGSRRLKKAPSCPCEAGCMCLQRPIRRPCDTSQPTDFPSTKASAALHPKPRPIVTPSNSLSCLREFETSRRACACEACMISVRACPASARREGLHAAMSC